MIVIGERINGFNKKIAEAIKSKNNAYIQELAVLQTRCGADYLDICAGAVTDQIEVLIWIIQAIQKVVDTPLCIDCDDVDVILSVLPYVKHPGIINSVALAKSNYKDVFSKVAGTDWKVIVLLMGGKGIPACAADKIEIAKSTIAMTRPLKIKDEQVLLDPLVLPICNTSGSVLDYLATIESLKTILPECLTVGGLSNVSYGMPLRKHLEECFLVLVKVVGLDAAIMDITDVDLHATLSATDALLEGGDKTIKFCNFAREQKLS